MYNQEHVKIANKTSRGKGFIGRGAITPEYVREYVNTALDIHTATILDFGAGKTAEHTKALLNDGYQVLAHEFGDNVDPKVHCELALLNEYDIVFASNVLNVQSSGAMARATISQAAKCVKTDGAFIANYPSDPRKSNLKPNEMMDILCDYFEFVTRVGGTNAKPLWCCLK